MRTLNGNAITAITVLASGIGFRARNGVVGDYSFDVAVTSTDGSRANHQTSAASGSSTSLGKRLGLSS